MSQLPIEIEAFAELVHDHLHGLGQMLWVVGLHKPRHHITHWPDQNSRDLFCLIKLRRIDRSINQRFGLEFVTHIAVWSDSSVSIGDIRSSTMFADANGAALIAREVYRLARTQDDYGYT